MHTSCNWCSSFQFFLFTIQVVSVAMMQCSILRMTERECPDNPTNAVRSWGADGRALLVYLLLLPAALWSHLPASYLLPVFTWWTFNLITCTFSTSPLPGMPFESWMHGFSGWSDKALSAILVYFQSLLPVSRFPFVDSWILPAPLTTTGNPFWIECRLNTNRKTAFVEHQQKKKKNQEWSRHSSKD